MDESQKTLKYICELFSLGRLGAERLRGERDTCMFGVRGRGVESEGEE